MPTHNGTVRVRMGQSQSARHAFAHESVDLGPGVKLGALSEGSGDSSVSERVRREGRDGDGIAKLAAVVCMSISVGYTTYLIVSSNLRSLSWFAFHPPLQMLAIGLFTYGILTLQPTNQPKTKAAGLTRHQLAMFLTGVPVLGLGTWVIYYSKNINARAHFTTWHGTIGIIAVGWMCVQILVGGASVWFGGAAFGGGAPAKRIWKYHRLSGYLLYPLFLYAAHLGGAWSTYTNSHASHAMRLIAYSIGPIITLLAIYSRIRLSKMKFF
ncbi:hypothetical protein DFH11DRAFT_991090 [Phellopilus nigrolimitatus]|nr:hypothetical protein DFH11DRAFT_991090 [Phellopilus nigrolimitatus]